MIKKLLATAIVGATILSASSVSAQEVTSALPETNTSVFSSLLTKFENSWRCDVVNQGFVWAWDLAEFYNQETCKNSDTSGFKFISISETIKNYKKTLEEIVNFSEVNGN